MARCVNLEVDKILDKEIPILNCGFVRLVDYMGGDSRIAEAARVSYNSKKTLRDDEKLIDYLYSNGHTSPFEQVILLFHIKMPLFVARQWVRHRTARMNEVSGRYSVMKEEFYVPTPSDIKTQNKKDKQASAEALPLEVGSSVVSELAKEQKQIYTSYKSFIEKGVSREMARINLPLSLYTEVYWQMDLHNLFHFLALRLSSHAQKEIREYAKAIFSICKKVAPIATASFEEHTLYGKKLSKSDVSSILYMMEGKEVSKEKIEELKTKLMEESL
ncbi:MAG: FAD-dependent thymidylate synthase [Treponema sp.]